MHKIYIQAKLGLYIRDYFPNMAREPHAELISPYFLHMKALLVSGLALGDVKANELKKTSAKTLYAVEAPPVPHAYAQSQGGHVHADQQHCCQQGQTLQQVSHGSVTQLCSL